MGQINIKTTDTPLTPATDSYGLYFDTSGTAKKVDDAGNISTLTGIAELDDIADVPVYPNDGNDYVLVENNGILTWELNSVNDNYATANLTATGSRTHTWAGFTLLENFVNGITNTFRGINALLIQSVINDGTDLSSFSQTKTYISSLIDSALGQNSITVRQDKIDIGLNSTSPLMINTSAGTSGQVLKSQGASLPPIWDSVSGAVDSVNGQTGVVVLDTDDISEGVTNLYNVTHTGQVVGSTSLSLRSEAISDQSVKSPITGSEYLLLEDGGTLYKADGNLFVNGSGAVMESDFSHSHSVLVQQGGTGSPETVNFSNNTILGKAGGGDLDALTATEVRTMINVADGARSATQVTSITLLVGSWSLVSGLYEYDLSNANITAASIVDIIPDNADIAIVKDAEILPKTESSSGAVKLFATNAPSADIGVTINIWK